MKPAWSRSCWSRRMRRPRFWLFLLYCILSSKEVGDFPVKLTPSHDFSSMVRTRHRMNPRPFDHQAHSQPQNQYPAILSASSSSYFINVGQSQPLFLLYYCKAFCNLNCNKLIDNQLVLSASGWLGLSLLTGLSQLEGVKGRFAHLLLGYSLTGDSCQYKVELMLSTHISLGDPVSMFHQNQNEISSKPKTFFLQVKIFPFFISPCPWSKQMSSFRSKTNPLFRSVGGQMASNSTSGSAMELCSVHEKSSWSQSPGTYVLSSALCS